MIWILPVKINIDEGGKDIWNDCGKKLCALRLRV